MQCINLDESELMKNDLSSSTAPAPAGREKKMSFPLGEAEYAKLSRWAIDLVKDNGMLIWHNNSGLAIVKDGDFLVDDCTAKEIERWLGGYQQRQWEHEESLTSTLVGASLQMPTVNKALGECYGGLFTKPDGTPEHHIVVLGAETSEVMTWWKALDWADEKGGQLPTIREMSLVYGNCQGIFENVVYWSGDQDAEDRDYVQCLNLMSGHKLRAPAAVSAAAFAIRRVKIEETTRAPGAAS